MTAGPAAGRPGLPLTADLATVIGERLAALRRPLGERALSDGTFTNLYLFREAHDYRYLPGPWPCVTGRAYDGAPIVTPLFDLATAPVAVLGELQGRDAWFFPLADDALARLEPGLWESRTVRDDSDYLYAADTLLDYSGPGLGPKRHAVTRLLATTRIEVMPLDRGTREAALEVLAGWCADKGRGPDEADAPACREAIAMLAGGSALAGYLHLADGVPAGLVIVEELNPGVFVVRFAKGRTRFDGIFAYLFQDLARRCAPGLRWLNFEQDLGNPNFRRTKLSFRPARLLAKHRVRIGAG